MNRLVMMVLKNIFLVPGAVFYLRSLFLQINISETKLELFGINPLIE